MGLELSGHLERNQAAGGVAGQKVGPVRSDFPQGAEIAGGHVLDARLRCRFSFDSPGLDSVHGLLRTEVARQALETQYVGADPGNTEQGRTRADGLNGDDRRPIGRVGFGVEQCCHLGDGWGAKERGQRQTPADLFLDCGKQSHGEQGVSSQVEEAVVDADPLQTHHVGPGSREQFLTPRPRRRIGLFLPRPFRLGRP